MVSMGPRVRQSIVLPPAILTTRNNFGCRVWMSAQVAVWQSQSASRYSNGKSSGIIGRAAEAQVGKGAATAYAALQKRESAWRS